VGLWWYRPNSYRTNGRDGKVKDLLFRSVSVSADCLSLVHRSLSLLHGHTLSLLLRTHKHQHQHTHTHTIARHSCVSSLSLYLLCCTFFPICPHIYICICLLLFRWRIVVVPTATLSLLELALLVAVFTFTNMNGIMRIVRQPHRTKFVRWAVPVTKLRSRVTISVNLPLVVLLILLLGIRMCTYPFPLLLLGVLGSTFP
jgi:hypothetical protein